MNNLNVLRLMALAVSTLFFIGCGGDGPSNGGGGEEIDYSKVNSKRTGVTDVILIEQNDCDKLHPFNSSSANSTYVEGNMFHGLMAIDPRPPFEYVPVLAESRPTITPIEEGELAGGLTIEYTIREEATWDNGEPITGYDVVFSLKAMKNPKSDCHNIRPYYEFVSDVEVNPENPKNFTMWCNDAYFQAEIWSAVTVYPEYMYDPEGIMRGFSIPQLNTEKETLKGNADIIRFADNWNSEKHQRDPEYVVGSGAYKLKEWQTGQRIILERKENWWGDALAGTPGFDANPSKIVYEIITDPTTAVTALKDEGGDVMRNIKAKDFVELKEDKNFRNFYKMHSPMQLSYSYIGLNMRDPKLEDKRVRQALCHAVDAQKILDILYYGLGVPTVGPIHPSKEYYNNEIEPYNYDLTKAGELLEEAGWVDADGDGVREKEIDGEVVPLSLILKMPQSSSTGEKIGSMMQEDYAQIGIELEIVRREWTVFLEENKNHDFEMYLGGWISGPVLPDPKQIWHSESYNGGGNYVGFGTAESDALIEEIRYELDDAARNDMYMRFQEMVHDDAPYIFLFSLKNRLAVHARFDNAEAHVGRPGYTEVEFMLNPNYGSEATP